MSAPSLAVQVNGGPPVSADNLNTYQQTCDTIAQLRAFVGVSGVQVYARGTTTIADGGQGVFYWNATGTAADDNGATTVIPYGSSAGNGEWSRMPSNSVVKATSTYSVTANETLVLADATTAAFTVTLPAANASQGRLPITIKRVNSGANAVTISSSSNIDGSATQVLGSQYAKLTVQSDGTTWWVTA